VTRALLILTALGASLAFGVGTASATNECRGLNPCVPVAGPWVIVPVGHGIPRPQVQFVMTCPRRYVVGGLDAELTERAIDVAFLGKSGSPVNPGITTSRTVVFVATYVGGTARLPSFRPHIGCLPGGGGRRTPTAVSAVVPPGEPTTRRMKNVRIYGGVDRSVVQGCAAGERLIAGYAARGFYTAKPPSQQLANSLVIKPSVRSGRFSVAVTTGASLLGVNALVQVSAVCAGGR
jgi:hypothetical protein